MEKWEKLRNWLSMNAALGHDYCNVVLKTMEDFDALEITENTHGHSLREKEVFYYSGVPDFDKKTWEKMLEERGIPGLA